MNLTFMYKPVFKTKQNASNVQVTSQIYMNYKQLENLLEKQQLTR